MKTYWVIGGEYADTSFTRMADDAAEERFGPFDSFEAAEAEWSRLSWQTVDNCHARYRIVEGGNGGANAAKFWVVGGRYADTSFKSIAPGETEEWAGPFETFEDAAAEWSRLAWKTVDDCHVRYRIVRAASPGKPA